MASGKVGTTVVSTKGQVILPKVVRDQRRWTPGTRLVVEETPEGVLLSTAPHFAATTPEQVFGSLKFDGKAKSIDEIEAALVAEARRRAGD
ncbi:AbrB family transcriptional regulator [Beijerinckiaceae bacterium RH AL1]|nr:AbrB/MazE/SpoVT family DNA-binding domain-containing protein [Beijerinckiaceae bacterium]VVB47613.1 AbrB family transcriptional regulator [Beijerinckiaceae bacterium RH CH11]VVB47694.1 AbrB family transcriptional regulator [Beijerinckiaceae bacterium RH AL8]VVC55977.1 AbrB family transcriptional regulator [Beijerinckiaceae bacterium RH AL1]